MSVIGEESFPPEQAARAEIVPSVTASLRGLAGHSLVYGVGGLLLRSLGFFLLPLYTRVLTPADYGVIAVATMVTALLTVLYPLGLHGALPRLYFDASDDRERGAAAWTLWLAIAISALAFTAVLDAAGSLVFKMAFHDVPYSPYLRLAVWSACVSSLTYVPLGLLQIQERSLWYVASTAGATLVTAGCIVLFTVVLKQGAYGYLKASLIASTILAVAYAIILLRIAPFSVRRAILRPALVYSLPLVPHALAGWALSLSDRAILERYVSLSALGIYALGAQVGGVMTLVTTSINSAWVPILFKTDAQHGSAAEPRLARVVTYYVLFVSWLGAALILILRPALHLIVAPTFQEASRVIPWIVAGAVFNGFYFIPANLLFLRSRTALLPLVTISAGIVSVSLNVLLAPRHGILAAAWANAAAFLVALVLAWILARSANFPYEYPRLLRVAVAGMVIIAVGMVLPSDTPVRDVVIRTVWSLTFPAVLYMLGFFTADERARLALIPQAARRMIISATASRSST